MDPIPEAPLIKESAGLKSKLQKLVSNFKMLSSKDKRLLSLGGVVAMFVALPLLVYTILTSTTNFLNRAASGEPTGEPSCTTGLQSASLLPSKQSGLAGMSLTYQLSITNTDSGNCTPETYSLSTLLPHPSWSASLSTGSLAIITGQTASVQATFTSSKSNPVEIVPVGVTVSGLQGNITASAGYSVVLLGPSGAPKETPTPTPPVSTPSGMPVPTPVPTSFPMPTPRPIPPPTIKPTPVPLRAPMITSGLIFAVKNRSTIIHIYGQDSNPNVTAYINFSGLPSGFRNGGCVNSSRNPVIVDCIIVGTHKNSGFFSITARITDTYGLSSSKKLLLTIFPWLPF